MLSIIIMLEAESPLLFKNLEKNSQELKLFNSKTHPGHPVENVNTKSFATKDITMSRLTSIRM